MKIAIVHDYLFQFGGAEKVIESWLRMYPEADLLTSFFVKENFKQSQEISLAIYQKRIKTTWLQNLFGSNSIICKKYFKHFFWLYPLVMSQVVLKNYDLVIISSTYCAKNVRFKNCSKIVHYCHSPTRFLHGLITETDLQTVNPILRIVMPIFKFFLKKLDLKAVKYLNKNNTIWFSNSKHIQDVIKKVYQTDSVLLYPPVEISNFLQIPKITNITTPYYYYFGRVSFHKRIDLAIQTCLEMRRKLVITGIAVYEAEMKKLQQIVTDYEKKYPQTKGLVSFTGRSSDKERNTLLSGARAFLFPGKEDFGIAPIEALASGTPIIAYQAGGALEYIIEDVNGVFFAEQTVDKMKKAILQFEQKTIWNESQIRDSIKTFDEKIFARDFQDKICNLKI